MCKVHEQVCSGTWRCAEVHRGLQRCVEGIEVCRGAQKVTEVHRCMWRCMEGAWRCKEVDRGVCGGGQRVYRCM